MVGVAFERFVWLRTKRVQGIVECMPVADFASAFGDTGCACGDAGVNLHNHGTVCGNGIERPDRYLIAHMVEEAHASKARFCDLRGADGVIDGGRLSSAVLVEKFALAPE